MNHCSRASSIWNMLTATFQPTKGKNKKKHCRSFTFWLFPTHLSIIQRQLFGNHIWDREWNKWPESRMGGKNIIILKYYFLELVLIFRYANSCGIKKKKKKGWTDKMIIINCFKVNYTHLRVTKMWLLDLLQFIHIFIKVCVSCPYSLQGLYLLDISLIVVVLSLY